MRETWVQSLDWEDALEKRKAILTPVFWPGEFHELHSPWGHKELDMTEQLSLHFISVLHLVERKQGQRSEVTCPGPHSWKGRAKIQTHAAWLQSTHTYPSFILEFYLPELAFWFYNSDPKKKKKEFRPRCLFDVTSPSETKAWPWTLVIHWNNKLGKHLKECKRVAINKRMDCNV